MTHIITDRHTLSPGRGAACPATQLPPAVFQEVDVEVDGGAEDGEEVGDLAHLVDPVRPPHWSALVCLGELPDVGDPPHSVAHNEH